MSAYSSSLVFIDCVACLGPDLVIIEWSLNWHTCVIVNMGRFERSVEEELWKKNFATLVGTSYVTFMLARISQSYDSSIATDCLSYDTQGIGARDLTIIL
jgi:hypothetical protein